MLTAPFAGTIVAFSKQQGSRVDAYEAVGVLADLGGVTVRGYLPAEVRERAAVGQAAVVQIDGYGGTPFAGAVSEIAAEAMTWQGRLAYEIGVTLDPDQALPTIARIGADIALAGATLPAAIFSDVAEASWFLEGSIVGADASPSTGELTPSNGSGIGFDPNPAAFAPYVVAESVLGSRIWD